MSVTNIPRPEMLATGLEGAWRVYVYHQGVRKDVTKFRQAPTQVSFSHTDPFGPAEASLVFPAITVVETPGVDELDWFAEERDVDIAWGHKQIDDLTGSTYAEEVVWEGELGSFDYAQIGVTSSCVGAMKVLDNFLATPSYQYRPYSYEECIRRAFVPRPSVNLRALQVLFPTDWQTFYSSHSYVGQQPYLVPGDADLVNGKAWTGLLTRESGRFEATLTSYVQSILQNMQAPMGNWTLDLLPGRQPVLKVRRRPDPSATVYEIDVASPGVTSFSARKDGTQKANAIYGQGKSITGAAFSGMKISVTGSETATVYEPYAATKQVHPATSDNPWFDQNVRRREVSIPVQDGLQESEFKKVADLHLQLLADPGVTGEFTICEDPHVTVAGVTYVKPRQTIRAGMTLRLMNLLGDRAGTLVHLTETSVDYQGNLTATYDTRYRDQLTVQEIRLRGRDSLRPVRLMTLGTYEPVVKDLLYPWSYDRGAGYMPKGSETIWRGTAAQSRLYENLPFPWTDLTKARPPKDPAWAPFYHRIGPVDRNNSNNNWSALGPNKYGFPVVLSAAGDIRAIQIAAYDEDGNVLPVSFHVSLYYDNTVSATAMPLIPTIPADVITKINSGSYAPWNARFTPVTSGGSGFVTQTFNYKLGQPFPFYPNAFNGAGGFNEDGSQVTSAQAAQAVTEHGMIFGYGNGYERAGFWPGSQQAGNDPTGMFSIDAAGVSYDFTQMPLRFVSGQKPVVFTGSNNTPQVNGAVTAYAMVYCDDQGELPVYFLGRIYRTEPGAA